MNVNNNFYDIYTKINSDFQNIMDTRINNITNDFKIKNMSKILHILYI